MDATLLVESKMMVSATFGIGGIPREPVVTISRISIETQEGDSKGERWGILTFSEAWAKPLKINRTHQKALILMFGKETDGWIGKRIGLFAKPGVYFGTEGTAVRIKGSPDLKSPVSFQVKKFGGGKVTYDLVPMGASSKPAPAPTKPADPPQPAPAGEKVATLFGQPIVPIEALPSLLPPEPAKPAAHGAVIGWGPHKGKGLAEVDDGGLLETIQIGEKKIAESPKESWAPQVAAGIAWIRTEVETRYTKKMDALEREPGADG